MHLVSRRGLAALLVLVLLLAALPAGLPRATAETHAQIEPVTRHPRLWLAEDDLPRLRGWATDANPPEPRSDRLGLHKLVADHGAGW